ncbi:SDR family oxidoreductase [Aromatoleum toluclasticum]|uniref:SDR family oxidoreductase n=1 Tax=Aromatoleum toluclasticum TaxID=92003 RepID=UPI001D188DFD|nr:SDR family oxidoreductase [Aromatoleum toluclasticum]MCC4118682.1 SDR family oxidoreductase [Aromatoleum toluclasticum]
MTTKLFDLEGKIALVSGASRGIGEEIARLLAEQGAHVIVSSRKAEDCQRVADAIREAGGSASVLACNVGKMEDIAAAFEQIEKLHGRLDILINNAAANPYYGHVLDTDLPAFTKTVEVNIRGYFFMSVEAGKMMKKQGKGAIVNVASVNALRPGENQGIYSITKAAIVNMTKAFARECGALGIRVNALLPGLTKTKFSTALFNDEKLYSEWVSNIPLRRHAEPREMAGTVLYLVSDAASYTNGDCIVVDGGMTL